MMSIFFDVAVAVLVGLAAFVGLRIVIPTHTRAGNITSAVIGAVIFIGASAIEAKTGRNIAMWAYCPMDLQAPGCTGFLGADRTDEIPNMPTRPEELTVPAMVTYLDRSGGVIDVLNPKSAPINLDQLPRYVLPAIVPAKNRASKSKAWLATYLQRAEFRKGVFGLEAAAQSYFGKSAKNLTAREAALLRGALMDPTKLDPYLQTPAANIHATEVLDELVKNRALKSTERSAEDAENLQVQEPSTISHAHFLRHVDAEGAALLARPTEDLVVETTLDLSAQANAKAAVESQMKARGQGITRGALVAIDRDGAIRAYFGGREDDLQDWAGSIPHRAGSVLHPIIFLAGLESGLTPNSPVDGEGGSITLHQALAESIPDAPGILEARLGGSVQAAARRLGALSNSPGALLSDASMTPLQAAETYQPLANGGVKSPSHAITAVRTTSGQVKYQRGAPNNPPVVGPVAVAYLNQMLAEAVTAGTGRAAMIEGRTVAGKTGTTADHRNAWFVGHAGGVVAAVWVGRGDGAPMASSVTGGNAAAPIWRAYMFGADPVAAETAASLPPLSPFTATSATYASVPLNGGPGSGPGVDELRPVAPVEPSIDLALQGGGPRQACQFRAADGWRNGGARTLRACVEWLFNDDCSSRGSTLAGRWGDSGLRMSFGQVAFSSAGRSYAPLIKQSEDCDFPAPD